MNREGGLPTVVGIDESFSALQAVRWAARDALRHRSPLRLLTAVDIPPLSYAAAPIPQEVFDELDEEGKRRLAEAHRTAAEISNRVEITDVMVHGSPRPALLEAAESARRIVLGTRGLGEITGMLVGSTTQALVVHAACPIAVIPAREGSDLPPETDPIIVGIDGSPISEAALAAAFDEASLRQAPLIALHAYSDASSERWLGRNTKPDWSTVEQQARSVLAERLAGWKEQYPDVHVHRVIAQDQPARYLAQEGKQAQLIVVGSRGRGGFQGMLLGSTSRALLHTTPCPLLIVRPQVA